MQDKNYYHWRDETLFLAVYVQPNANKNAISGKYGEHLKIKINAPPHEDRANQELINFLAKFCRIAKNKINITQGTQSRNKLIALRASATALAPLLKF